MVNHDQTAPKGAQVQSDHGLLISLRPCLNIKGKYFNVGLDKNDEDKKKWMHKGTVSQHMFWLSSKKIILYLHTLNESRISGKGVHMY